MSYVEQTLEKSARREISESSVALPVLGYIMCLSISGLGEQMPNFPFKSSSWVRT